MPSRCFLLKRLRVSMGSQHGYAESREDLALGDTMAGRLETGDL